MDFKSSNTWTWEQGRVPLAKIGIPQSQPAAGGDHAQLAELSAIVSFLNPSLPRMLSVVFAVRFTCRKGSSAASYGDSGARTNLSSDTGC